MTKPTATPTPQGIDAILSKHPPLALQPAAPAVDLPTVLLDLDALDDNPDQHRDPLDVDKVTELAETIRAQGLLQNILARQVGGRHQIIAGHRRCAAFRLLRDQGDTAEERARWARIPAKVVAASDEQSAAMCLLENVQREDLSPVEEGGAYARMMDKYGFATAKALAQRLGIDEKRVSRRLRLYQAPSYIRDALSVGVRVEPKDQPEGEAPKRKETRRLQPDAALEFLRLHAHYLKKYPGLEPKKADPRPIADVKAQPIVEKALSEGWTRENVRAFVDRAIEGRSSASVPGEAGTGEAGATEAAIWERKSDRIVIHLKRLSTATPVQREQVLRELQAALSATPPLAS